MNTFLKILNQGATNIFICITKAFLWNFYEKKDPRPPTTPLWKFCLKSEWGSKKTSIAHDWGLKSKK